MDAATQDAYEQLLLGEVVPALGCTEPSAIALATAKAREVLGAEPATITVVCSGNIIKNALSVIVPHARGQSGIKIAAALGVIGGDASAGLEVLAPITDDDIARAQRLVHDDRVKVHFVEGIVGLYVAAKLTAGVDEVTVELKDDHSRFHSITRNGVPLVASGDRPDASRPTIDDALLDLASILAFADGVDLAARRCGIGLDAFTLGQLRVHRGHAPRQALAHAGDQLRRQADLRHQQQRLLAARQHVGDQPQIDLGLATAGDAVEHENRKPRRVRGDLRQHLALRCGQRRRRGQDRRRRVGRHGNGIDPAGLDPRRQHRSPARVQLLSLIHI